MTPLGVSGPEKTPFCRLTRVSSFTVATSNATAISWNSVRSNYGGMFQDNNPKRITIREAGVYCIGGHVLFDTNTTGSRALYIAINGGGLSTPITMSAIQAATITLSQPLNVVTTWWCPVGTYFELIPYQTTGSDLNVIKSQQRSPEFWAFKVG